MKNLKLLELLNEDFRNPDKVDAFRALRLYAKGKIDQYELESYIPEITRVQKSPGNIRGKDEIIIELNSDSDFFDIFGFSDDDAWIANSIDSGYYEFQDYSSFEENWREGYTELEDLDKENLDKLNSISKKLVLRPFNELERGGESMQMFLEKLKTLFPRQYENIIDYILSQSNQQIREAASDAITKDINKALQEIGFTMVSPYWKIKTTVANLIMLYASSRKMRSDLTSLLKDMEKYVGENYGGWSDDMYSYQNYREMDWDSINRNVGWELDKILDLVEEDVKLNEFVDFYDRITSKFLPGTWYQIPKNRGYRFKIDEFDPQEMKVKVLLNKVGDFRSIPYKFTEEALYNFLVQYELFPILNNENFYRSLLKF